MLLKTRGEQRAVLAAFRSALRRESHVLLPKPYLLWQQLFNQLQWIGHGRSPESLIDILNNELDAREASGGSPWLRLRHRPPISAALVATHGWPGGEVAVRPDGHVLMIYSTTGGQPGSWSLPGAVEGSPRVRDLTSAEDLPFSAPSGTSMWADRRGTLVATWDNGDLHVTDTRNATAITCPVGTRSAPRVCRTAADILAVLGVDGSLSAWDMGSLEPILEDDLAQYSGVQAVDVSPDGRLIALTCEDGRVVALRTGGGGLEPIEITPKDGDTFGDDVGECCVDPDSRRLAVSVLGLGWSEADAVVIVDLESGEVEAELEHVDPTGVTRSLPSVDWSPDGQLLATGYQDAAVRIWDTDDWSLLATLEGHASGPDTIRFDADSRWLLSRSDDGTAKLWDVRVALQDEGDPGGVADFFGVLGCAAISADASLVVLVTLDGLARVTEPLVEIVDAEPTMRRRVACEGWVHQSRTDVCAFSDDGELLVTLGGALGGTEWYAHVHNARGLTRLSYFDNSAEFWLAEEPIAMFGSSATFSRDDARLAVVETDGTVLVWGLDSQDELFSRRFDGRPEVALHPTDVLVAVAAAESIAVFDLEAGEQIGAVQATSRNIIFSEDGSVVIAEVDDEYRVWGWPDLEPIDVDDEAFPDEARGPLIAGVDDGFEIVWAGQRCFFPTPVAVLACRVIKDDVAIMSVDAAGRFWVVEPVWFDAAPGSTRRLIQRKAAEPASDRPGAAARPAPRPPKAAEESPQQALDWAAMAQAGEWDQALSLADEALSDDSHCAWAWLARATSLHGLGRGDDACAAAREFLALATEQQVDQEVIDRAHDLIADHESQREIRADTAIARSDWDEALSLADEALSEDSHCAWAWLARATSLFQLGSADESLAACERALAEGASSLHARLLRLSLLLYLERWPELLESTEEAIGLHPRQASFLFAKASALHGLGRGDDACAAAREFLALATEQQIDQEVIDEGNAILEYYADQRPATGGHG